MLLEGRDYYTPAEFMADNNISNLSSETGQDEQAKKLKRVYVHNLMSFDIETTKVQVPGYDAPQAVMYVWQWAIEGLIPVIGHTWDEFLEFAHWVSESIYPRTAVVLVHNLMHEFAYLKGVYDFSQDDVFAVELRRVLKCSMFKNLEFRCTYLHSNMGLDAYTAKYKVKHEKLKNYDYSKTRYPWTDLQSHEISYQLNDVLGLIEAYRADMESTGDNLYTIPLTSTGYVRRDAKKAMKPLAKTLVKPMLPDEDIYLMLREAFRGGNTHANRFYANSILHDVKSVDRASSYPAAQLCDEYPVSPFVKCGPCTYDQLKDLIVRRHRAVVMRIALHGLKQRYQYDGCPYLSRAKCRNVKNAVLDNGRILSADYLETTITDVDFSIILDSYDFSDLICLDAAHAKYGMLPEPLKDVTREYFRRKTLLKGDDSRKVEYDQAKALLNAIYGCSAQDPVKEDIIYKDGLFDEDEKGVVELLKKSNEKAWQPYQWGCWITSRAREALQACIKLAGDNFVYCDTDSVKYVGEVDFEPYNTVQRDKALANEAYAFDGQGKPHYMGVFEQEKGYEEFITLGAKKYAYRQDGKLGITIAGVNKEKGARELEAAGGLEALKPGFVFVDGGGTCSYYNDNIDETLSIDGRELRVTDNVAICNTTYTVGLTDEYIRILDNAAHLRFERFGW